MSDLIEEAAKAICSTMDLDDKEPCARLCTGCKIAARAVLTRLREPTPGMVAKGAEETHGEVSDEYGAELATDVFRAMIDAALEGK